MCEVAILAFLCTGLSITTTIAGRWLNSLILYDNKMDRQLLKLVPTTYIAMSCDDYSFYAILF